ncbi:hypothetical protein DL98DRAFT_650337 [Cadophora sp. DSE1049]|nr:hypothetical protein DL98DRAFT_650337 [Cadophora sp. DSE1049]
MARRQSTNFLKQERNAHLLEIRRRKGVDGSDVEHNENGRDLDRVLNIMSDQLYQTETHFILELIQNADDNTFDNDVVPTLSFHVIASGNSWQMLIVCNETGFQKENIEALCRIGDSTKKNKDSTTGYIGEKGIGFKSVFKVADIAQISSRGYSFRLDRRPMLGMITPILETFPPANLIEALEGRTQEDQTQILLELLSESEFRSICNELQNLKPQILIFLRKIRKLIIHTPNQEVQFEIRSVAEDQDFDGETATVTKTSLQENRRAEEKYVVVRRIHRRLPEDERRKNVKATEVVLAFPVDKWRPLVHAQDTYAFLPIDDYGFNYLIQADFLLVANRESVESTKWNDSIRVGLCRAFVRTAVPRFNRLHDQSPNSQNLRYTWPLFLKDRGGTTEFWLKLKEDILNRLSEADVLESRYYDELTTPKSLYYIPKIFRLNGQPLVEDETTEIQHLSFLYDSETTNILPELKKMHVKEMDFSQFCQELRDVIKNVGRSFLTSQSEHWHSKIALLFCVYGSKHQSKDIPLIPISDGRWVKPSHSNLFLEGERTNAEIPAGLDICLVDRPNVPLQTPRHVYNGSINKLQVMGAGRFSSVFRYASRVYIDYPDGKSIISKHAEHPESPMPILNRRYLAAAQNLEKEVEFVEWACSRLKMSLLPRLVDEWQALSPEFQFLKAHAMEDLLILLRDNWDHYARDFVSGGFGTSRLKRAISEMRVPCTNGLSLRLDQTVIPRRSLKLAGPNLTFVDVPEPSDSRWLKVSTFGVLIMMSAEFYIRELKALSVLPVTDRNSTIAVEAIYTELGTCKDPEIVRKAFAECRLAYLPELERWVFLSECVWNGPQQLESTYKLSSVYPTHSSLFRNCLHLEDANLGHVIKELEGVTDSTSFHKLQQLLLLLNQYLSSKDLSSCLSSLIGKKIIPVTTSAGEKRMNYNRDIWYFADRQSLWDRFNGKIPLISFDVRTVGRLTSLINAMGLSDFLLSKKVKQKIDFVGLKMKDKERTYDLRERARYFVRWAYIIPRNLQADAGIRLLPKETKKTKSRLLTRLLALKVWGVQALKLTQEVHDVKVTEETNQILFDDTDDSTIEIYLSIKGTQKPKADFELSKEFIRYCVITDHSLQGLVLPIIQYPLAEIENLLEGYGLDAPIGYDEESTELLQSTSVEKDDESGSTFRDSPDLMSSPKTPNRGANTLDDAPNTQASRRSSLRDNIPALNQSIAFVREVATLPSTTPTVIVTSSRVRTTATAFLNEEVLEHSIPEDILGSAGKKMNRASQSTTSRPEDETRSSPNAFDFANFHTEFSETFGLNIPSQSRQTSSTQNYSTPKYSRSPRYSRSSHGTRVTPDPESTMFGLQMQKIGLLGESFVNAWLSCHLMNSWDATRHWTSRNRNNEYPQSPFVDSEKDYADFTYPDNDGELTKLLGNFLSHDVRKWSSNPPTYHLEVKSTSEGCNEPFYMSNNQMQKARRYTISDDGGIIPKDVYAIIRVYSLEVEETTPGFTVYADPWALYLAGELNFLARENYSVTPKDECT